MVVFKDFEVCVRVNGEPLQEFRPTDEAKEEVDSVTRYIMVESGAFFDIKSKFMGASLPGPRSIRGVSYATTIDGVSLRHPRTTSWPYEIVKDVECVPTGDGHTQYKLQFADLRMSS